MNRNRLKMLNDKGLQVPFETNVKKSIETIQFIGQQHAFLTDITKQLNICYTFKVWHFVDWIEMFEIEYCCIFRTDFGLT